MKPGMITAAKTIMSDELPITKTTEARMHFHLHADCTSDVKRGEGLQFVTGNS
jgi:hypothetical protein